MNLLMHAETQQALAKCVSGNAHAFMLVGPTGAGKTSLAMHLAAQLLAIPEANTSPAMKRIQPEKGSIGIDAIRNIQQFMRLKTTGHHHVRRVVLVEDAHTMTTEAQNAFLKLLEEPPADTRIILTVASGQHMLATIHSRAQTIVIQPPSAEMITQFFSEQGKNSSDIQKAYLLSGGQIGLMAALLTDDTDHPLLAYVDSAKQFLAQSAYERLTHLDEFAKDREQLALFLRALGRMSTAAFEQAALSNRLPQAKHWHRIRHTVLQAEARLGHSPNVKLTLTDLSLTV